MSFLVTISLLILKPNSWANNLVEVSGHNLESSQAWGFSIQSLHYKPVSNHFGSGEVKSIRRCDMWPWITRIKTLKTVVPITSENSASDLSKEAGPILTITDLTQTKLVERNHITGSTPYCISLCLCVSSFIFFLAVNLYLMLPYLPFIVEFINTHKAEFLVVLCSTLRSCHLRLTLGRTPLCIHIIGT